MASAGWSALERLPGWKAKSFRCMKSFGALKNAQTSKATFTEPSEQPGFGRLSWTTSSLWGWTFRRTTSIQIELCDSHDPDRTVAHLCPRLRGGIAGFPGHLLAAVQGAPREADDQPTPGIDCRTRQPEGSSADFAQGERC